MGKNECVKKTDNYLVNERIEIEVVLFRCLRVNDHSGSIWMAKDSIFKPFSKGSVERALEAPTLQAFSRPD